MLGFSVFLQNVVDSSGHREAQFQNCEAWSILTISVKKLISRSDFFRFVRLGFEKTKEKYVRQIQNREAQHDLADFGSSTKVP